MKFQIAILQSSDGSVISQRAGQLGIIEGVKTLHVSPKVIEGVPLDLLKRQIDFIPFAEISLPPGAEPKLLK